MALILEIFEVTRVIVEEAGKENLWGRLLLVTTDCSQTRLCAGHRSW